MYAFIQFGQILGYGKTESEALLYAQLEGYACINQTVNDFKQKGAYSIIDPLILQTTEKAFKAIEKDINNVDFTIMTNKHKKSKVALLEEAFEVFNDKNAKDE